MWIVVDSCQRGGRWLSARSGKRKLHGHREVISVIMGVLVIIILVIPFCGCRRTPLARAPHRFAPMGVCPSTWMRDNGNASRACLTGLGRGFGECWGVTRTSLLTDAMWARIEPLLPDRT